MLMLTATLRILDFLNFLLLHILETVLVTPLTAYSPYIYQFDSSGKMINAIRPPDAVLPLRNGSISFSANSPPTYDPKKVVIPGDPTDGRQNNQGFEGLTVDPAGGSLWVLLQSAAEQEGGQKSSTRRYTRLLKYNISRCYDSNPGAPTYVGKWVVPLPTYQDSTNSTKVAAQSEIHFISDTQFLILSRDSGAGHGQSSSASLYRHADVFDISKATNVMGPAHDAFNKTIASGSKLWLFDTGSNRY